MNMTKGVNAQSGEEQVGKEPGKQVQAIGSQYTKDRILHEINNIETEIELRYSDYQTMVQGLEQKTGAVAAEEKDPLKIRVARWLVDRPKRKPQTVNRTDLTGEQRDLIEVQSNELLQEINRMIARREELKKMLEPEDQAEIDERKEEKRLRLIIGGVKAKVEKASLTEAKPSGSLEDKTENDYSDFIVGSDFDVGLRLTPEQQGKLLLIVKDYNEAVATAREFDTSIKVPSKEQIIAHIMNLGGPKLEKIASVMGKPALIITPANQSLKEMKNSMDMDVNKHYDKQKEANFNLDEYSGAKKEVGVSIVDMQQYTEPVPGQQTGRQIIEDQLRTCEKYYKEQGMHLIHDYEYAVAMQRSLRAYKKAKEAGEKNPERHIMDFYGESKKRVTMFNQEHNKKISIVAYGDFEPYNRGVIFHRVEFNWFGPGVQDNILRGRGSVQVM